MYTTYTADSRPNSTKPKTQKQHDCKLIKNHRRLTETRTNINFIKGKMGVPYLNGQRQTPLGGLNQVNEGSISPSQKKRPMQATQHKTYTHRSCKTRIHIQPHTLHHSYICYLKIHERHTQSKGEDMSTALAWSVEVTYYWGLEPVYVRTTFISKIRAGK